VGLQQLFLYGDEQHKRRQRVRTIKIDRNVVRVTLSDDSTDFLS
jgi:hypothetical protein